MKVKEFMDTQDKNQIVAIYGWFSSMDRYSSLWGTGTVKEWEKDSFRFEDFEVEEIQDSMHNIKLIYLEGKKKVMEKKEKCLSERKERRMKTLNMRNGL